MSLAVRVVFYSALSMAVALPAHAASAIGSTQSVVRLVTGEVERRRRELAVGDPVHLHEMIRTEPQGATSIRLKDNSRLSLGSNTELTLDEFVYNPNRSGGEIVFSAARGALRFISGEASKEAYRVNTPLATVGIRGTDFDTFVDRFGTTLILLRDGIVNLCTDDGSECVDIVEPRTWALVNANGVFGPFPWDGSSISDILFSYRPGYSGAQDTTPTEDEETEEPVETQEEEEEKIED